MWWLTAPSFLISDLWLWCWVPYLSISIDALEVPALLSMAEVGASPRRSVL